jgi:hypothetical protein
MKRIIFILILFVSQLLPVQIGDSEARELDWKVKEFLSLPAISDEVANIEPKEDDREVSRPKRSAKAKKPKQSVAQKPASAPEISGTDLCQSGGSRVGEGGSTASGEAGGATCGILPSEQLLSTWSDQVAEGRSPGVGAMSFQVLWQGAPSLERPIMALAPIDCVAGGISTVRAAAYSASGMLLASGGPWNCSGTSNSLYDIPAGSNLKLVVTGNNASGNVLYRGEQSGVMVNAGETTAVGTIHADLFSPQPSGPGDGMTIAYGLIGFTWQSPYGATSYRIQVSRNKGFTSPFIDANTLSPSYHMTVAMEAQTYFWRVRAQDAFNNNSEWSTAWVLTVDTASPFNTTAAEFINNGVVSTNSATVSLSISAARNNGVAAYLISENPTRPLATAPAWVPVALTTSYAAMVPYTLSSGEGMKALHVWFKDASGNVSKVARDTILLDMSAPDTIITGAPVNPSKATSVSVLFTSPEPGTTFLCSLDSGAYTVCASPHSYLGLREGSHTIEVKASDKAGNIDPVPAQYAWTVDTTPPESMVTDRPLNFTNATTADFVFTSSEPISTFLCSVDGAEYAVCGTTQSYAGLGAGAHTIDVRAIDIAGNLEPIPVRVAWMVDLTPPETAITVQPALTTNSTTDSFIFSSTEAGSTFQCQLDNGVSGTCSSPHAYAGLAPGPHTFTVRAIDSVGNSDETPARYTWNIDTTPPDAIITAQPANPTNAIAAEFNFASTEDLSSFQCSLDGAAYAPCSSPQAYLGLAEGIHTIDVQATDEAGNTDPIPARYVWAIDLTPPDTAITIQPANPTNATATNFSFSSSKPGSIFECSLDNGEFAPCESPQTYAGLVDGAHSFAVKATDAVGNIDSSPAQYAWDIDTTPPETAIIGQPSDPSSTAGARFSFHSSKSGSSFECQLDNGQYSACASPFSYNELRSGSHTFTVRAMDAVGNIDPTPESFTWVAILPPKNTTPSGFINKGGAYYVHSNVVKLTIAAMESDGQGVRAYYASEDPTPPTPLDSGWVDFRQKREFRQHVDFTLSEGNGKKTVYVWFKDSAGNMSEAKSDTIYYFNAERLISVFLILQLIAIL